MAKIHAKTYSQMLQDHDLFIHQLSLTPSDKHHDSLRSVPTALPNDLVRDIFKLPKLTREQCGHLRHFHNLASQPDGDWSFMGGASGQDHDEGSYRYQLASMAYAAGAAHYHRLPALRSVFQALLQKMIRKMLHPEVWSYWYLTSQSGKRLDPDLKQLRRPWADPVRKENVMYSGHLLLMVSLYSMLFGDDHFDQKDGIIFNWDPMFWGMGPERFSYNRTTLQGCILKQMERSGWMGACCEPNMVFIIIATRYNDVRNHTNIIGEVLAKYKEAWSRRGGFISANGLFRRWYAPNQDLVLEPQQLSHSAWIMAFMPWNSAEVKQVSSTAGAGFLQHLGARTNIRPPELATEIRRISAAENADPDSPSVVDRAWESMKNLPPAATRSPLPAFGFIAQWLSEIEGPSELDPLLRHADQYLHPTWHEGGLFYRRNPPGWDDEGNYLYMEPYSGNAAIGYARLNVQGGQKRMYEEPWTKEDVLKRPCIEGVGLDDGVDFLRGVWVEERKAMVVTVRSWEGKEVKMGILVKGLKQGRWGVYVDGGLREVVSKGEADDVRVQMTVGGKEVDVVVVKV
ncbi:MAG: hypothetical protein L6R39_003938 [Caloplaca ligustica]|nr:MAG: hypothetical protein L6R39_003938 [Caloplaca ligustica]